MYIEIEKGQICKYLLNRISEKIKQTGKEKKSIKMLGFESSLSVQPTKERSLMIVSRF